MTLSVRTPAAEVAIDEALVSRLLSEQHSDLAHLPLRAVEAGWDNAMFRLGDDLAVRFPRRTLAAGLIGHEQRWLPCLAKRLSIPVPTPQRTGKPGQGYPWSWSIVPWLQGQPADRCAPIKSQAAPLGGFLRRLHVPPPAEAPANPFRGVPLAHRAAGVKARMDRLSGRTGVVTPQVKRIWKEALEASLDGPTTWLHGDLHPANVLVDDGVISAVIDWGDITAGDCATDLASVWMLFADSEAQKEALRAYGPVSEATLKRAKGWAVVFALSLLDTGLTDNPRNAALGERILQQIQAAP